MLLRQNKMEFEIINQKKNPFLNREEYQIKISSESSPSFDEIKKELKKEPELTVVKRVQGGFGTNQFNAEVFVYDNKESKDKVEKIPKKIRKKMEEEAKKKSEEEKSEKEGEAKSEAGESEDKLKEKTD